MRLFLAIILLLPCSAVSFQLSTAIKNPFMPVEGYSGTDAIQELIKKSKIKAALPLSVSVSQEDILFCKKKCKNAKGIFAATLDCQSGCTVKGIEDAILAAAKAEIKQLKTM